jgi:membrane protein required for colicin V production
MTGFDIIVLVIVGVGAIGGFMRGLVAEVASLAAWVLALLAIRYLHTDLTAFLYEYVGTPTGAAVLAFALLLLIPYAGMKLLAANISGVTRNSVLGPIDRVLGFGFGAIKGAIIAVLAFSVLVLGYDTIWGPKGRPDWITTARAYPLVDASSVVLVQMLDERRRRLRGEEPDTSGQDE